MNNRPFTRVLEIIWLTVGIVAALACVNGLLHHDLKNGILMGLCSVIGFLMFYMRRYLRRDRDRRNL